MKLYSVSYSVLGNDRKEIAWFDSLEMAKKFASQDYTDRVVTHYYNDSDTISEILESIIETSAARI